MREYHKTDLWVAGLIVWTAALVGFTSYAVRGLGFFSKALVIGLVTMAVVIYMLLLVRFSKERKMQYESWKRGEE